MLYNFHSSVFPMLRFPCMVFVNKRCALYTYDDDDAVVYLFKFSVAPSRNRRFAHALFAREMNIHDTKHYLTILLFFVCLKLGLLIFLLKVKIASCSFH